MVLDTFILSRAQFGFTVGFHILFPTLNIGLGLFIAIMEARWLKTKNPAYLETCKFWTKVFALTFGMGVVSGIVLSYELGTNFGRFIHAVGGVLGPLFSYEVLSAFFLEAGFLGIMLFGWKRVPPKVHFMATLLVSIGTIVSAFWIMSANSWMQTPTGFHIENGTYIVDSWLQVIFNPSFLPRFFHMLSASFLTACFVIAGVSAWYLLNKRHETIAKPCFSFSLTAGLLVAVLQIGLGDLVGIRIHEHQPLKTAAIEGIWETQKAAPLILFGVPDSTQEKNHYTLSVPYGASLINTHHLDGELIGLKSVPAADRPAVASTFWSFRVMVGIGFLMLGVSLYALWLRVRGKLYQTPGFYRLCIACAPLGFVAAVSGWLTAEFGRQPWVVYQLMRTIDGASQIPFYQVACSFTLFILVYGFVFSFYLIYLFKLIKAGPAATSSHPAAEAPFKYLTPEEK